MKKSLLLITLPLAFPVWSATYYVDSANGNDASSGLAEDQAWKTLIKVNAAAVQPGDVVKFKRGGLWRGSLFPKSGKPGAPVTYTWYGAGRKPIIQPSLDRSRPEDWVQTEPGVWATLPNEPILGETLWTAPAVPSWSPSFQNGYEGTAGVVTENGETFYRVKLNRLGKSVASNFIQLWGVELKGLPPCILLDFEVRATKPFTIDGARVMSDRAPYTASYAGVCRGATKIGTAWQKATVLLSMTGRETDRPRLHFNLGDVLPEGGQVDIKLGSIRRAKIAPERVIDRDVGIVVINDGEKWGVKKWGIHGSLKDGWTPPPRGKWLESDTFKDELDYCYDPKSQRLFMKCDRNPGEKFRSIELGRTMHAVSENGAHDVVYEGLWIRYAAAHGFGGGSVENLVIRNCDVSWIGGGLQFWKKDPKTGRIVGPVRFGNGIEFWGNCHNCLIERCRLWEVYDAAVTNQGRFDTETDVTWRDNVIWNSEYSYEYWNAKLTANILFEHNTCVDAGYGWAHAQRPDINGAHLMYYSNTAKTSNFVVRNNVFCRATEWTCRSGIDWREGLTQDHNLVYNAANIPYLRWKDGKNLLLADWKAYQELGFGVHSLNALPIFKNEAKRDYRLAENSPGFSGLSTDGTPVGARNMPGLDEDQSTMR